MFDCVNKIHLLKTYLYVTYMTYMVKKVFI
jgi:hypothetical protein